jgi:hypothetical protein
VIFLLDTAMSRSQNTQVGELAPKKVNRLPGGFLLHAVIPVWSSHENSASVGDKTLEILIQDELPLFAAWIRSNSKILSRLMMPFS